MEAEAYIMLAEQILQENSKVSLKVLNSTEDIYKLAEKLWDARDYIRAIDVKAIPTRFRKIIFKKVQNLELGIEAREEMLRARLIEIVKSENYRTANLAIFKAKMILRKNASIPVRHIKKLSFLEILMDDLHSIERYFLVIKIDEMSYNFLKKYAEEVRIIRLGVTARRDELVARYWEIMESRSEIRKSV